MRGPACGVRLLGGATMTNLPRLWALFIKLPGSPWTHELNAQAEALDVLAQGYRDEGFATFAAPVVRVDQPTQIVEFLNSQRSDDKGIWL